MKRTFTADKVTKGAIRFKEDNTEDVGSVYVKKAVLKDEGVSVNLDSEAEVVGKVKAEGNFTFSVA